MTARLDPPSTEAASKALAGNHGFSLISDKKLLALYAALLQCRLMEDENARRPGSTQTPLHQHAAAVACILDLHREDAVIMARGSAIHPFLKGAPLELLLGRPEKDGLAPWIIVSPDSPEPTALLNAAIARALTNRVQGQEAMVAAFTQADAASESFLEALRFAAAQELPILFVLHPAAPHARTAPRPARGAKDASDSALGVPSCGFPIIPVDGADLVALYRVAAETIARIRQGRGPTIIECITLPDTQITQAADPLAAMETYLQRKGLFNKGLRTRTEGAMTKKLHSLRGIEKPDLTGC